MHAREPGDAGPRPLTPARARFLKTGTKGTVRAGCRPVQLVVPLPGDWRDGLTPARQHAGYSKARQAQ